MKMTSQTELRWLAEHPFTTRFRPRGFLRCYTCYERIINNTLTTGEGSNDILARAACKECGLRPTIDGQRVVPDDVITSEQMLADPDTWRPLLGEGLFQQIKANQGLKSIENGVYVASNGSDGD